MPCAQIELTVFAHRNGVKGTKCRY